MTLADRVQGQVADLVQNQQPRLEVDGQASVEPPQMMRLSQVGDRPPQADKIGGL